jgi:hypothetical protein
MALVLAHAEPTGSFRWHSASPWDRDLAADSPKVLPPPREHFALVRDAVHPQMDPRRIRLQPPVCVDL